MKQPIHYGVMAVDMTYVHFSIYSTIQTMHFMISSICF